MSPLDSVNALYVFEETSPLFHTLGMVAVHVCHTPASIEELIGLHV